MKISGILYTLKGLGGLPWGFLGPLIIVLALLAQNFRPDPPNERVAAGLVDTAYRTARGSAAAEQYSHSDWEKIERRYGRVRNWHILAQRPTFLSHRWEFDVDVTREQAVTREVVVASAGPSRLYGYYSSVGSVRVESAHP